MRGLATLVLAAVAVTVYADEQRTNVLAVRYNAGTTLTYCRSNGQSGSPTGAPISVTGRVTNTASSTTVTSVNSAGSFTGMGVGDVLFINRAGTLDTAVIQTWTNANSVVVDTAADWNNGGNGYTATWRDLACGTTINDGWIDVSGATRITFNFEYNRGDATPMGFRVECRTAAPDAQPVRAFPSATSSCGAGTLTAGFCTFTAAQALTPPDALLTVVAYEPWNSCRIGIQATADAADTVGNVNMERVNASIVTAYAW